MRIVVTARISSCRRARPLLIGAGLVFCSSAAVGDTGDNAVRGYTGSALSGYTGSALSGYTGSALSGYTGSALSGYTGSALSGYTGSALSGYTGSALSGYTGSAVVNGYYGTGVVGFGAEPGLLPVVPRCLSFGDGFTRAVMGPVESITVADDSMTIQILGQVFDIPPDDTLAVGDYVVAAQAEGHIGAMAYPVGVAYVPGASLVRIKASASEIDPALGQATLGTARVDYTAMLSTTPRFAPRVNDLLVFAGVQPTPGSVIMAGPDPNAAVRCSVLDGRM
jgi:hypothetical protein